MSKQFAGTKGRATVSVAQKFVQDEGGILAVSFPDWHRAIEVYAHSADGSMSIGEANAELVADAFNMREETGLTPRQLAEQRAELLEAAKSLRDNLRCVLRVNCNCDDEFIDRQTSEIDAAIANAQGDAA